MEARVVISVFSVVLSSLEGGSLCCSEKSSKQDFQKIFVGPKREIHFLFRQDGKASSRFKNGEGGLLINKNTTALMPPNVLHKTSKTWMDINDIYALRARLEKAYDYLSIHV